MKRAGVLAVLLLLAAPAVAQAPDAVRARIAQLETLAAANTDPSLKFLLASDYVEAGERAKAVDMLRRLADQRAGLYPGGDSPLLRLADDAEAGPLLARMRRELPVVRRARIAHVVDHPGLVPEGLAYDPVRRRLFLGDMAGRRILRIDADGRSRLFAGGLALRPLGLKADPARRRLWAATTNAFSDAKDKRGELLLFDLDSGRRLARYAHPEATSFNDMDVAPNGDLYVSDSAGGSVFRLPAAGAALERLIPGGRLGYPNGVAVSGDGRHLFVAQGIGPVRIDLATRELLSLPRPPGFAALGLDGLYWRDGALIGVQNFATPGRVVRLELSPERDRIIGARLLEAGHPRFAFPTTAALAPDRMFVLANAQLRQLKDDGSIADPATLDPIVILELPAP